MGRKKCKVRFLAHKENNTFQKSCMKVGGQEVATCGHGASKDLGSPCSGDGSHGKVNIEETDGSSSGQKEHDLSLSLFMEAFGLEVEEELSTMATQYWTEGVWTEKHGITNKEQRG